ncbi:MAG: peptidoglycan D,D-transpeptidase FtsI family protein [Clostridium sp.]
MDDNNKSIKQVMIVFLFLLVGLISYIAYFQVFKAPKIAEMDGNKRLWAKRNEILRGTIYDRNGTALTKSERDTTLNQKREYVYPELYANVLGYVNPVYGLAGLEDYYDEELTTYSGVSNSFKNFMKDFNIDKLKESFKHRNDEENKVGNSLKTTLDTNIQQAAFDALGDNKGAIVALNPKTGEVLAMVSKPTFNTNDLENAMKAANAGSGDDSPLINRAIHGVYPPGSIFKTITTASALQNIPGVTNKTFVDDGKITFPDGRTLSNAGGASYGNLSLKDAFRVSSNDVYGGLAMELGNEKLKKTAESFGFNSSIPAVGFNIKKSNFPKLNSSEIGNIAQSGIGQSEITTNPMQMALVGAAIANDGVIMQPKLINEIVDKDGNSVKKIPEKEYTKAISKEHSDIISDYMKNLVDSNLNSKWPFLKGTNAAGKTGTADYLLPNGKNATPHSWFLGFAPANDPEIVVAVIVENGGFGAGAAATAAGKVINTALKK